MLKCPTNNNQFISQINWNIAMDALTSKIARPKLREFKNDN